MLMLVTLLHFNEVTLDWQVKKVFKVLNHCVCDILLHAECRPNAWAPHRDGGAGDSGALGRWCTSEGWDTGPTFRGTGESGPSASPGTHILQRWGTAYSETERNVWPLQMALLRRTLCSGGAAHPGLVAGRAITVLCVRDLLPHFLSGPG